MKSLIYFVQVEGGGPIKIGFTEGDPRIRMSKLQSDCPWPVQLLGAVAGDVTKEAEYHRRFDAHRIQSHWFNPVDKILAAIREALSSDSAWAPPGRSPAKRTAKYPHPLCSYVVEYTTQAKFARDVHCSESHLSLVLKGERGVSIELAKRISKATGGAVPIRALVAPEIAGLMQAAS